MPVLVLGAGCGCWCQLAVHAARGGDRLLVLVPGAGCARGGDRVPVLVSGAPSWLRAWWRQGAVLGAGRRFVL